MKIKKKPVFLLISALLLTCAFSSPVFASENKETNDDTLVDKNIPTSVTGEKIDGNATVVDYTFSGEKEFYTIVSADDSVYYLVIDNEKDNSNVYFLRNINDEDFSVKNNVPSKDLTVDSPTEVVGGDTTKEEAPKETKSNSSLFMMIAGLALFGGGAYYFKIVKPKKEKKKEVPDEELDEFSFDENEIEEEIETIEELNKDDMSQ